MGKKDKKEKKKKEKLVYYKPIVYSQLFDGLYNNQKYSDLSIKLEKTGEVVYVHKNILSSSSEYFSKLFSDNDDKEITINEEDSALFKEFLQFFYTGSFNCIKEENTFKLIMFFNKYKVKNPKDFKTSPKTVLKGIISYVESDLSKREEEFSSLASCVNFKKIEKDELKKFGKKSKWLSKNKEWLNIIVQKDSDDEGSDSDKSSNSDSDSDKSESESEESEDEEGDDDEYFPKTKLLKSSWHKAIHKWTKQKKKWKLIFRASKDGFSASTFHSKCDNQGPTIVIIKSSQGNIFGGYNSNSWTSNSSYQNSNDNFLFLCKGQKSDKLKKPVQLTCKSSSNASYSYSSYGPTFGGGHDLYISDGCNSNNSSYTNLNYSYNAPNFGNSQTVLAGSYNFTVVEYEVYRNLKKNK